MAHRTPLRPLRAPFARIRPGSTRARTTGRWSALLLVALAGGMSACSDEPAPADDTAAVTSDLLTSRDDAGAPPTIPGLPGTPRRDLDLGVLGHTEGDLSAPLRIVEFSDFGCGYCRQFHLETYPSLREDYVATGKAVWKYVPIVLGMFGSAAEDAAEAGECALEQGRFPAMRDRLFEEQREWKGAEDPVALFRGYAEAEGLDVERWEACMASDARWDRIASGTAIAIQLGLRGTPTFYIAGVGAIPGALPADLFSQVLDTAHAEMSRRGPSARPPLVGPPGS